MKLALKIEPKDNMDSAFEDCRRKTNSSESLFVAFFDGNGLKRINDTYGHQVGDIVIFEIAQVIADCTRDDDRVVRFGGDEFVLFLTNFDKEFIRDFITRVQNKISNNVNIIKLVGSVNVSVGVAEYNSETHGNLAGVLQEADMLMYAAKKNAPHFSVFSGDNVEIIDKQYRNKRKSGYNFEEKREYFSFMSMLIQKKNPDFNIQALIEAARFLWNIRGNKTWYLDTPKETEKSIIREYEILMRRKCGL